MQCIEDGILWGKLSVECSAGPIYDYKNSRCGALLFALASSQTSTFSEPNVPTGTPVAGNYTGSLRPQVHYSPPINFMNDPNGMFVDANGTWHLYYQYDATGIVAGNQYAEDGAHYHGEAPANPIVI